MSASLRVEVIYAEAGQAWRRLLVLDAGASVADALCALVPTLEAWPAAAREPAALAIFGRECQPSTLLRDGDRLELLRPLPTDPKLARRERAMTNKPR